MFTELMASGGGGGSSELELNVIDSWSSPSGVTTYTYNGLDPSKDYIIVVWSVPSSGLHLEISSIKNNTFVSELPLYQAQQWTKTITNNTLTIVRTSTVTFYVRLVEVN